MTQRLSVKENSVNPIAEHLVYLSTALRHFWHNSGFASFLPLSVLHSMVVSYTGSDVGLDVFLKLRAGFEMLLGNDLLNGFSIGSVFGFGITEENAFASFNSFDDLNLQLFIFQK